MPEAGLEPAPLSGPDPKSGAAANFATRAFVEPRTGIEPMFIDYETIVLPLN